MLRWMAPPRAVSRRWKSAAAALLALVTSALVAGNAEAETRFALVIGNGAYRNVPALDNPTKDSAAVAKALEGVGFTVVKLADDMPREAHPALVALDRLAIIDGFKTQSARDVFEYREGWGMPTEAEVHEIRDWMNRMARDKGGVNAA